MHSIQINLLQSKSAKEIASHFHTASLFIGCGYVTPLWHLSVRADGIVVLGKFARGMLVLERFVL